MRLSSFWVLLLFSSGGAMTSYGSSNLYFSGVGFDGEFNLIAGATSGLLNAPVGVVADGMSWGLVVFTKGDFESNLRDLESLKPFDLMASNEYLNESESLLYLLGRDSNGEPVIGKTENFTNPLTTESHSGSVISAERIDYTNLTPGAQFAIVWFPQNDTGLSDTDETPTYGYFTVPGFVIPANSSSANYYGVDYTEMRGSFSPDWPFVIPEPSTYALAIGAVLCATLVVRRRCTPSAFGR